MTLNIIRQHQHTPASGHPSQEGNKYYLYILECADKTLYTGITVDLDRRVREHNSSKLGAKYTLLRRPVRLVYSKKYSNRSLATKAESKVKSLSRKNKLDLVARSALPLAKSSG